MNKLVRMRDVQDAIDNLEWYPIGVKVYVRQTELVDAVDSIPAVDAVEVRHGHWVTEEEAIEKDDYSLRDTCSVCGHCDWDCTESENFNFCPNCGAKMDGRREDGEQDA